MIIKNLKLAGHIMWGILFLAFFLYAINWFVVTRLNPGLINTFFNGISPSAVTLQSVNWTLTLVSAISSFLVGYLIVKLSHKYATWIALSLLSMSIFAAWMPNFTGFTIMRMFMGMGGSMLAVLMQPLISTFFSQKSKSYLSILSPWAYSVGSIVAFIPFLYISNFLNDNWQITETIVALLNLIPLILYILIGKNFEQLNRTRDSESKDLLPTKIKKIIKEKNVWFFVLAYSCWATLRLTVITFLPLSLFGFLNTNFSVENDLTLSVIFSIVSLCGSISSVFLGLWNRTRARVKPYLIFLTTLSFICFSLIIISTFLGSFILLLTFGFFFGFFSKGAQGVLIFMPHEYKGVSSKRIGNIFALMYGISFLFYTIITIIATLFFELNPWISIAIFLVISILIPIFISLMTETRKSGKFFPKFSRKKIYSSKLKVQKGSDN